MIEALRPRDIAARIVLQRLIRLLLKGLRHFHAALCRTLLREDFGRNVSVELYVSHYATFE
jgi:hypothetical protein